MHQYWNSAAVRAVQMLKQLQLKCARQREGG